MKNKKGHECTWHLLVITIEVYIIEMKNRLGFKNTQFSYMYAKLTGHGRCRSMIYFYFYFYLDKKVCRQGILEEKENKKKG